jgi:hypothetical protein
MTTTLPFRSRAKARQCRDVSLLVSVFLFVAIGACRPGETPSSEKRDPLHSAQASETAPESLAVRAMKSGPAAVMELYAALDTAGKFYCNSCDIGYRRAHESMVCWIPNEKCTTDEPGWDLSVIVSAYRMRMASQSGDHAAAEVRYSVIGTFDSEGLTIVDSQFTRQVARHEIASPWPITGPTYDWHVLLRRLGDRWRIVDPESQRPPFVSVAQALAQLSNARDSARLKDAALRSGVRLSPVVRQ